MTLSERIELARASLTRNGVTYTECTVPGCRYVHLMVDGRAWAEWTHPRPRIRPAKDMTAY